MTSRPGDSPDRNDTSESRRGSRDESNRHERSHLRGSGGEESSSRSMPPDSRLDKEMAAAADRAKQLSAEQEAKSAKERMAAWEEKLGVNLRR